MGDAAMPMRYGRDPNGFPIDLNRPFVQMGNEMLGTEYTATDRRGERFYNYPTIWGGRLLAPAEARKMFELSMFAGGWPYPNYGSLSEALAAAPKRSRAIGRQRGLGDPE